MDGLVLETSDGDAKAGMATLGQLRAGRREVAGFVRKGKGSPTPEL